MQQIFQYDNNRNAVELNVPEILLITEFKDLLDVKRNISKEDKKGTLKLRAFKEFTYIWLALDWKSIYADYDERERHELALKDSGLTQDEFDDPVFRTACRKYKSLQNHTKSIQILNAARGTIDKFIDYFNNLDPEERDPMTGKPIFKVKDIMIEISQLSKVLDELKALENQVKKDIEETSTIRGGASDGFLPKF